MGSTILVGSMAYQTIPAVHLPPNHGPISSTYLVGIYLLSDHPQQTSYLGRTKQEWNTEGEENTSPTGGKTKIPTVILEEIFFGETPKTYPWKINSANAKFRIKNLHVLSLSVIRMVVYRLRWDLHRGGRRQHSPHFFTVLLARSSYVLGTLCTTI